MKQIRVPALTFLVAILLCANVHATNASLARSDRDSVMKIFVGGGMSFSSINMRMEPLEQFKTGWNARAGFKFRRRLGVTCEYTYQFIHLAEPAWENIHTTNTDINFNYLYFNVSNTATKFYAISGVCFQNWKGEYKGPAAVNQDNLDYKPGDIKTFNWTSLNLGMGFEQYFNHLGLFGEFKFRFGKNYPADPFGIVDVGITLGAKFNLLSIGGTTKADASGKPRNKRHRIASKQYHWF